MKKQLTLLLLIASLLLAFSPSYTEAAKTWSSFSGVSIDKEWKITFSSKVDLNSTKGNVYIQQGSTKVPVTVRTAGRSLYVKPVESLKYYTNYTVIVNDNVKDVSGKNIKNSIYIPFVTEKQQVAQQQIASSPEEIVASEYSMNWHIPAVNYNQFYLEGVANGNLVGRYDTRKNKSLYQIQIGKSTIQNVKALYGAPVDSIQKGNTLYRQSYKNQYGNETHGTYLIGNEYVTFFYDNMKNNVVRSITSVSKEMEQTKPGFYKASQATNYRNDLEKMMVHLINESRVAAGLNALTYTPSYNNIARLHSIDMATYNYFSHTDRAGNSALQRMINGGLQFYHYGENLAYGQYSAIYAHESLMNSEGHRRNIMSPNFTHVIVGVAFTSNNVPYFTINFYSK